MNDKNMQKMLDEFLNRNGVLGQYYSVLISSRGVDSSIVEHVTEGEPCPWHDAISSIFHLHTIKWTTLDEMWRKELREAGL